MAEEIRWNKCPKEIEEQKEKLYEPGSNQLNNLVSEPHGIHILPPMKEVMKKIYNFEVRSDDIWIVTYPKCGTTMTQEMVWQIVNKVDTEKAKIMLFERTPFIEMEGLLSEEISKGQTFPDWMVKSVEYTANLPSPRVIKTHLPFEFLPPKLLDTCKVIFVCRNPKDTCVSFYHHHGLFPDYKMKPGKFSEFANLFLKGTLEYGSYWTMLKSAWKYKDHPNMKIVWFEEIKEDMMKVIREISKFIGYHMTEYKILKLDDHLYIDNFRQLLVEGSGDESMKSFIRKGKVGDWKNYFNEENNQVWDKWIAENLEGTDIVLPKS